MNYDNSKPVISIVVPIYKVEDYLQQCVDSILGQTYKNLEVILVDDGSPDHCGKICDKYKQSDSRVKVIHKKNGGLSDARNAGLKVARGEYIAFIDSDDIISIYMMEKLYKTCKENDADVSICKKQDFIHESEITESSASGAVELYTPGEALKEFLVEEKEGFVVAWNKLYKKSLFNDNEIQYPVGKLHEDCFTTYRLFLASNRVAYLDEDLYFYRHRSGSIMTIGNYKKNEDILDAYSEILDLVNTSYPNLKEVAEYRYIITNLIMSKLVHSKGEMRYLKNLQQNVRRLKISNNQYLHGQRKVRALLLKYSPQLLHALNERVYK